MSIYQYKTSQVLSVDINRAWKFFSSPNNLAVITPPEMDFKILTNLNGEEIYDGMKIDYIVKPLFSIPLRWKTEISNVKKPNVFMDKQITGPYKLWEHTHLFTDQNGKVLMSDIINYQLPFGFIGKIAHVLFVRKKIEAIFTYRKEVLEKIFNKN